MGKMQPISGHRNEYKENKMQNREETNYTITITFHVAFAIRHNK